MINISSLSRVNALEAMCAKIEILFFTRNNTHTEIPNKPAIPRSEANS